jgi:Thiol-activated cytolysin
MPQQTLQAWDDLLGNVAGNPGNIVEIDCASVDGQLHVCTLNSNGHLWHTIRFNDSWQAWGDVLGAVPGNPGGIVEIDCASVGGQLHLCARDSNGRLWHTIRFSDSWQPWGDVLRVVGNPGNVVEFNCAGIGNQLHLCVRDSSGRLWHTIRFSDSWQPWGDVLRAVAGNPGNVVEFNCAGIGDQLHLCVRDSSGRLWHTIRFSDSWQPWGDVLRAVAGNPGNIVEFNCTGNGSELHLCARNSSGRLWYTIRFSNSWQAWGDILAAVVGNIAEGVEVVAYVEGGQQTILAFVRSIDNHLWANWRDTSTGTWQGQDQGKLWNTDNQTSVLNSEIDRLGRMPIVVTGSTSLGESQKPIDVSGVAYTLTEQKRRLVNEVVEHAFLQDIAAMGVWPGQVIQGKALLSGDVAAIGPFQRQPGTIQITTDLISNTPRSQSVSIDSPDAAKVGNARRDLINTINPTNSAGLLKTSYDRAYTMREVGVKFGLSVKGSNFSVDANATFDETYKSTVVVAVIRQIFYSVTFTPQSGGASGFWTDGQVSYQNLAPYVGSGNPPLYVDSVQYGRFICVTVQGSYSSTEITAALKGSYQAAVEVGGKLDVNYRKVLENSQVKIYTIGVPGYSNFQDVSSVDDLQQVYRSGLSFSPQNPGAPISFTCRHIADNSLAKVGLAAEYTQPLSAVGVDINQRPFQVYDGPGGGFVDTQIRVNPGDNVKISAGGRISSGVVFSEPHGPQGWGSGHPPDQSAPLPTGSSAYCLLHRFGTSGWIDTMNLWEGSVPGLPGTSGGILQLNINDNNTQNGDPAYKWNVSVDVKRAGAGAVGIYV